MWMMGYKEGGGGDPMSGGGRKLRPLIPRLSSSSSTKPTDLLGTMVGEQSKREAAVVVSSSRWNPTAEQLRVLEELYRRGTRTPSADQIQQITSQLRRYGKIEGKNVFYWFQNHKARERQKRRRQMESSSSSSQDHQEQEQHIMGLALTNQPLLEFKDPGSSRTGYEVEQTKNWIYSTACTTQPQESVTREKATMAVMAAGDCRSAEKRWVHLDDDVSLLQPTTFLGRNATWQMVHLPPGASHHHHPIMLNSTTTVSSIAASNKNNKNKNNECCCCCSCDAKATVTGVPQVSPSDDQTLQLFPLRREEEEEDEEGSINGSNGGGLRKEKEREKEVREAMNGYSSCLSSPMYRFYEFLPLKN